MSEIRVEGLWKEFQLGETFNYIASVRDLFHKGMDRVKGNRAAFQKKRMWALKDIDFSVQKGEVLGIIGANGSGKSTLLKLLCGILKPTKGRITTVGRVGALIELGAGFHGELTGRENAYVNAAIIGLSRKELNEKFDSIVEFGELDDFIDTPVKRYSSGMVVRLGFAIAVQLNPHIMLIDEVLAVGDMSFHAKCMKKIAELKEKGIVILFVSHNLHLVQVLCENTLYLSKGVMKFLGPTRTAIDMYTNDFVSSFKYKNGVIEGGSISGTGGAKITRVAFLDKDRREVKDVKVGDSFIFRIEYETLAKLDRVSFTVGFHTPDRILHCSHSTHLDNVEINDLGKKGVMELTVDSIGFVPSLYLVGVSITDELGLNPYDWHQMAYPLNVRPGQSLTGLFHLPHSWNHKVISD